MNSTYLVRIRIGNCCEEAVFFMSERLPEHREFRKLNYTSGLMFPSQLTVRKKSNLLQMLSHPSVYHALKSTCCGCNLVSFHGEYDNMPQT